MTADLNLDVRRLFAGVHRDSESSLPAARETLDAGLDSAEGALLALTNAVGPLYREGDAVHAASPVFDGGDHGPEGAAGGGQALGLHGHLGLAPAGE